MFTRASTSERTWSERDTGQLFPSARHVRSARLLRSARQCPSDQHIRSAAPSSAAHDRAQRFATAVLLALATVVVSSGIAHATGPNSCQDGAFCAWNEAEYRGRPHLTDLRGAKLETCLALPAGLEASSFINRTGKPVTVYQDPTCSTDADFSTYPSGTFIPNSPYVARAIQIWTH